MRVILTGLFVLWPPLVSVALTAPPLVTAAPAPTPPPVPTVNSASTRDNIKDQGASASQAQGAGASYGLSAASFASQMAAEVSAGCPSGNTAACTATSNWGLAVGASIAVAGAMQTAKDTSDQTVADVSTAGAPPGAGAQMSMDLPLATHGVPVLSSFIQNPLYQLTLQNMQIAQSNVPGLKVNFRSGAVQLPDGTKVLPTQMSTAKGLAQAGLSTDQIKTFQSYLKQAMSKGIKAADSLVKTNPEQKIPLAPRNSQARGPATIAGEAFGGDTFELSGPASAEVPLDVTGFVRMYHGQPIGIAGDDLFAQVNRRYNSVAKDRRVILPRP